MGKMTVSPYALSPLVTRSEPEFVQHLSLSGYVKQWGEARSLAGSAAHRCIARTLARGEGRRRQVADRAVRVGQCCTTKLENALSVIRYFETDLS